MHTTSLLCQQSASRGSIRDIRDIARIEPYVLVLVRHASQLDLSSSSGCRSYVTLKRRVAEIVGNGARRPELRTAEAYEIVMRALGMEN